MPTEISNAVMRPSLTYESITFSGGQTVQLDEDEIIVFVGPNNAGKSAALKDLESYISTGQPQTVVKNAKLRIKGNEATFLAWLESNSLRAGASGQHTFAGMGYHIHHSHVAFLSQVNKDPVANFFRSRVGTEGRLSGADPAPAIQLYFTPATHPIHLLMNDDTLAEKMSSFFAKAFDQDLAVFRAGGAHYPLMVGQKPALEGTENELSRSYVDKVLERMSLLQQQGDGMRSFATVLLHVLVADNYSVQFLDEPEAFLHPPQAKLLGQLIAKERQSSAQLFVATHSQEVLEGILSSSHPKIRLLRIERDGQISRVTELSRQQTATIASSTLTRYSRILSGVFHKRVIIAESDADCLFYSAVLESNAVSGDRNPDVLFVHASGKHRMRNLVSTLRPLDVPISVIADLDLLREQNTFKDLFEALGGSWSVVEKDWETLNTYVSQVSPPLTADQVKGRIESEIAPVAGNAPFPRAVERKIKEIFKAASSWDHVKKVGRDAFGRGQPIRTFDRLSQACSSVGLWLVSVGELEGFCRTIDAKHGPDFAEKVLSTRCIEDDPELEQARAFMSNIWSGPSRPLPASVNGPVPKQGNAP